MKNKAQPRSAFTLVELLVAIVVIGILASMVLVTLNGAAQDAKVARTRATIQKINNVILSKYEEFRYRSVKLPIPNSNPPLIKARELALVRTVLLRDAMRMEMPDRMDDLTYSPTNMTVVLASGSTVKLNDFGARAAPRDYNALRRNFNLSVVTDPYPSSAANAVKLDTPVKADVTWTADFDAAECLYAIVSHSSLDGAPAMELFHASEIGDADGDSFPEFHDAWGVPITWVRWPAGYPSNLNVSYKISSPDAFNPYRTGDARTGGNYWTSAQIPWTLIPIVISGGPDKSYGLATSDANYALTRDAFEGGTISPKSGAIGNPVAASDNITSHDLLVE